ncbi:MAG TPA: translation initiation factor IF-2 subunit alpha [archaeon]|nr:translation initiation factor IF-2 subunit alpha [archaeon]
MQDTTQQSELPNPGEIVVCKIIKVLDYGVFVELLDFDNTKGFVHISQVASGWIKNIRNFVKEGQVRAAQVVAINEQKNQIDLSFTKISDQAQKARLEEWKQFQRAKKILEVLAEQTKKPFEQIWDSVAEPLINEYGSLQNAFQQIVLEGESAAQSIKGPLLKPFVELVQKSIEIPEKTVKGTLDLKSFKPDGVELIKSAIAKGMDSAKEKRVEIAYLGAGKYLVKATSTDFKKAEKALNNVVEAISKQMKTSQGIVSFEKAE